MYDYIQYTMYVRPLKQYHADYMNLDLSLYLYMYDRCVCVSVYYILRLYLCI